MTALNSDKVVHEFTHTDLEKALEFASVYCEDKMLNLVACGEKGDTVVDYIKRNYRNND